MKNAQQLKAAIEGARQPDHNPLELGGYLTLITGYVHGANNEWCLGSGDAATLQNLSEVEALCAAARELFGATTVPGPVPVKGQEPAQAPPYAQPTAAPSPPPVPTRPYNPNWTESSFIDWLIERSTLYGEAALDARATRRLARLKTTFKALEARL